MIQPAKLSVQDVTSLFPHFRGVIEIGEGGFKTVFKGSINGIPEALKVIAIPRCHGSAIEKEEQEKYREECFARVRREVEILGRCSTPYLVKLGSIPLEEHEINGDHYSIYSEEFLDGPDLSKEIKINASRPSEEEAKVLMRCLLFSIKELWSMRYIHRDIKPANVIKIDNPSRPFVLIDLGIAFGLLETGLTVQGFPRTNRYLAPEMANPSFRSSLDYRTDLYTLALTVFEFSAAQHPIARDNDDQIRTITRALHEMPKSLLSFRPDFSERFCKVIDQLLKKKPALRPSNLESLIELTES